MHPKLDVISFYITQNESIQLTVLILSMSGGPSRRQDLALLIKTKPHNNATSHDPNAFSLPNVTFVTLETNYFALESQMTRNQWTIYKYHVTFEPECVVKSLQMFLLSQHKGTIGGYLFDGTQLFTTRNLHGDDKIVEFTSITREETEYRLKILFTRVVLMSDQESQQVLNLIQRRNMRGLHLQLVGRNYYDPLKAVRSNDVV